MKVENIETLAEAKQYIKDELVENERVICPCCDQTVGRYRRRLNKGQVFFLLELFKQYKTTKKVWHFYRMIQEQVEEKHKKNCTDYAKLKDFGLIGSKCDYDDDGKSTGYFCISRQGIAFLNGEIELPKYLYQTNKGNTFALSEEQVHITNYIEDFRLGDIKY